MNSDQTNKYLLVMAGGSGMRMGTDVPKQFLLLNGLPVLMHTIKKFKKTLPNISIVVILPENQIDYWKTLCLNHSFEIEHKIAHGGQARFNSVLNGLKVIEKDVRPNDIIAVQDGVRPFVSDETIKECFRKAEIFGAAIPVLDVVESLRFSDENTTYAMDRTNIKSVQTPQVFMADILYKAYHQEFREDFTDDATVVERTGIKIHLVNGNRENIKITTPLDLILGEAILKH